MLPKDFVVVAPSTLRPGVGRGEQGRPFDKLQGGQDGILAVVFGLEAIATLEKERGDLSLARQSYCCVILSPICNRFKNKVLRAGRIVVLCFFTSRNGMQTANVLVRAEMSGKRLDQ